MIQLVKPAGAEDYKMICRAESLGNAVDQVNAAVAELALALSGEPEEVYRDTEINIVIQPKGAGKK